MNHVFSKDSLKLSDRLLRVGGSVTPRQKWYFLSPAPVYRLKNCCIVLHADHNIRLLQFQFLGNPHGQHNPLIIIFSVNGDHFALQKCMTAEFFLRHIPLSADLAVFRRIDHMKRILRILILYILKKSHPIWCRCICDDHYFFHINSNLICLCIHATYLFIYAIIYMITYFSICLYML